MSFNDPQTLFFLICSSHVVLQPLCESSVRAQGSFKALLSSSGGLIGQLANYYHGNYMFHDSCFAQTGVAVTASVLPNQPESDPEQDNRSDPTSQSGLEEAKRANPLFVELEGRRKQKWWRSRQTVTLWPFQVSTIPLLVTLNKSHF